MSAVVSELGALQTTLAAEHAAVYVYGVLGGRTSGTATPRLLRAVTSAYAAHRGRRDALVRRIDELGGDPVVAAPAYDVAGPLTSPGQVRATALRLERACAATYSDLVATTTADARRWAIGALRDAAVRELSFGGAPETLPGITS